MKVKGDKPWFRSDDWLNYEFDDEILELMSDVIPDLKRLLDALETRMVDAARANRFGEMFAISWTYGDVSNLVTEIETMYPGVYEVGE